MRTGPVLTAVIDNIPVQVIYTRHFIDRYERDEPGRPAGSNYFNEDEIRAIIEEAVPAITANWKAVWDFQGLIRSQRDLNMTFKTTTEADGLHVIMKNMMMKREYLTSPTDVVLEVGDGAAAGIPAVRFPEDVDADLRAAVMDHLLTVLHMVPENAPRTFTSPEAVYKVTRRGGDGFEVSQASWLFDTHYFDVD